MGHYTHPLLWALYWAGPGCIIVWGITHTLYSEHCIELDQAVSLYGALHTPFTESTVVSWTRLYHCMGHYTHPLLRALYRAGLCCIIVWGITHTLYWEHCIELDQAVSLYGALHTPFTVSTVLSWTRLYHCMGHYTHPLLRALYELD